MVRKKQKIHPLRVPYPDRVDRIRCSSLPNINDLKSDFAEVAAYRNKNNTGPFIRIYAVSVKEHFPDEIQKYGDLIGTTGKLTT